MKMMISWYVLNIQIKIIIKDMVKVFIYQVEYQSMLNIIEKLIIKFITITLIW